MRSSNPLNGCRIHHRGHRAHRVVGVDAEIDLGEGELTTTETPSELRDFVSPW